MVRTAYTQCMPLGDCSMRASSTDTRVRADWAIMRWAAGGHTYAGELDIRWLRLPAQAMTRARAAML